jgi:peptide/nickel transport system substrate-binding protein
MLAVFHRMATLGDPAYYSTCRAYFICGTTEGLLASNFVKARALLKEAGYDGTPIVLLHSTDVNVLANLAPVARQLLERAGFVVDLQSMDWQTLVTRRTKKEHPRLGGWHGFLTATFGAELLDPAISNWLAANCDKALPMAAFKKSSWLNAYHNASRTSGLSNGLANQFGRNRYCEPRRLSLWR